MKKQKLAKAGGSLKAFVAGTSQKLQKLAFSAALPVQPDVDLYIQRGPKTAQSPKMGDTMTLRPAETASFCRFWLRKSCSGEAVPSRGSWTMPP
jgi:hypothetical protein